MTKELEALNKIQHNFGQLKGQELVNCYELIFNGLKRLESIDNASPSEALECLEELEHRGIDEGNGLTLIKTSVFKEDINTIKQALLKSQQQEKVLEIMFKKNVNLEVLSISNNVNSYNKVITRYSVCYKELTQEEFDLLKR